MLPRVCEEFRRWAASRMARRASDQTLQPTALVHAAWPRPIGHGGNPQRVDFEQATLAADDPDETGLALNDAPPLVLLKLNGHRLLAFGAASTLHPRALSARNRVEAGYAARLGANFRWV